MSKSEFKGKLQDILVKHKYTNTLRTDEAIDQINALFAEAA